MLLLYCCSLLLILARWRLRNVSVNELTCKTVIGWIKITNSFIKTSALSSLLKLCFLLFIEIVINYAQRMPVLFSKENVTREILSFIEFPLSPQISLLPYLLKHREEHIIKPPPCYDPDRVYRKSITWHCDLHSLWGLYFLNL